MNEIPDIYYDGNKLNPCIYSPNAEYAIFFEQTKETLIPNADLFKEFITNIVSNFRKMRVYTHYKSYLYEIGLNRCQMLGNITSDMAKIEMHHNGLTIFDIALIISMHLLNTVGQITTYDIINHLRLCHINNETPIVMLCRTMHQVEHNDDNFYVPVQMTFGDWKKFIEDYKYGLTYGISRKLDYWIGKSLREQITKGTLNQSTLILREKIKEWSEYNECGFNNRRSNVGINPFNYGIGYIPNYY